MKRSFALCWLFCGLFLAQMTYAIDVKCDGNDKKKYEELICDYSILNSQYSEIWRQQEDFIETGRITQATIDSWKEKRDSCADVACMDAVFAEWKIIATSLNDSRSQAVEPIAIEKKETTPIKQPEATVVVNEPPPKNESSWVDTFVGWIVVACFLGFAVWILMFIDSFSNKCPKCNKRGAGDETNKEVIGQRTQWVEREVEEEHRNKLGEKTGSSVKKQSVPVEVKEIRTDYKCKYCGHEWSKVSTG